MPAAMTVDPEQAQVKAAGGLVWRPAADGGVEVAVVHRPRYDDWSFPKGKLDPGEGWEAAALREVREEIGLECSLGRELSPVAYADRKGRSKAVRYWLMEPRGGAFAPNEEVDEVRWLAPDAAAGLLSYPHDAALLDEVRT
jgi:8-oxo-dGTP pyrophosphatase MutT (NUDIX family)